VGLAPPFLLIRNKYLQPETSENTKKYLPKLIAWEVTRSCNLNCQHCRAAAQNCKYPDEFTTDECYTLLDNIASFAQPIIILTGGEPMLRDDIYDIARYGNKLGLRMVMAPCGMLLDDKTVNQMLDAGIQCISISIDGATAESHDAFRQVKGAFDGSMAGIEAAQRNGLPFQINTTITQHNLDELPDIMKLAEDLGAITFNPFLLVPTGRGKELAEQEISPEQYEQTLHWLNEKRGKTKMSVRVTCAPHYQRIVRQYPQPIDKELKNAPAPPSGHPHNAPTGHPQSAMSKGRPEFAHQRGGGQAVGCMGGKSFAFISHVGKVQICGFLEEVAGDLRENNLNFEDIWNNSPYLRQIRDVDHYAGKCSWCEFRKICGGCRARAYALTDNYLESEPFCVYEPRRNK
jgi:radical SAM protein with 4Fe4S-binding SPASM domain